jgi:hypothetical protein
MIELLEIVTKMTVNVIHSEPTSMVLLVKDKCNYVANIGILGKGQHATVIQTRQIRQLHTTLFGLYAFSAPPTSILMTSERTSATVMDSKAKLNMVNNQGQRTCK